MTVGTLPAPPGPSARRLGLVRAAILGALHLVGVAVAIATVCAALARTPTWVALGIAGDLALVAAGLLVLRPRRRGVRVAAHALLVASLSGVALVLAPTAPRVRPGALVTTHYVDGATGVRPWFQGLPEAETIRLGAWAGLTSGEAVRGAPALDRAYADLAADGLFERDESALLDSWLVDREHYWLAVPRGPGPHPLVVFVHGDGGSFQLYPQLLARPAVARGLAIAFPSHGFRPRGGQAAADRLARLVEAVAREIPIDRGRISLMGLSGGGRAVMDPIVHAAGRYRAIVAVSCVYPDLEEGRALATTRVLLLHGANDERTRLRGAEWAFADLTRVGAHAELDVDPAGDHLAILVERDRWVPRVLDWLAEGR